MKSCTIRVNLVMWCSGAVSKKWCVEWNISFIQIFHLTCSTFNSSSRHEVIILPFNTAGVPPFSWICFGETLQVKCLFWARAYRTCKERMFRPKPELLKWKHQVNIRVQVFKVPAFTSLFILSGTVHPSDFEGSINLSLVLLITSFPSTLLMWSCVSTAWITAEGGFLFPSVKPSGCRRRTPRWVTTNIRVPAQCHTCITQGHVIFKACRLQHVT